MGGVGFGSAEGKGKDMKDAFKAIFVFGPGGCGKTSNSQRLADAYGCNLIVDGWSKGDRLTNGALHLSNVPLDIVPAGVTQVDFEEACVFAGIVTASRVKSYKGQKDDAG